MSVSTDEADFGAIYYEEDFGDDVLTGFNGEGVSGPGAQGCERLRFAGITREETSISEEGGRTVFTTPYGSVEVDAAGLREYADYVFV
ncbi:hypothetical protein [Arenibaculum pallidiluteum]|uniref:hypothetical protein n=1 Tax=Arenibaculum pallidiluteum TaxID=2812559 RepID=UPI001A979C43|nr:hypothetical protein [Arenibaculum pallidiluteum]